MPEPVYSEDTIDDLPTGPEIHEKVQDLRDELSRMEAEKDDLLALLREVLEADEQGDLEDVLNRIREVVEEKDYFGVY